jgi:hypothetical protein
MIRQTVILCVILVIFPLPAFAGWLFGPDNYDDCVLEKMKGQDSSMRGHAMRACRELFPIEPVEKEILIWSKIKIAWEQKQNGATIEIRIEENLSNYNISKIRATFSTQKCDEENLEYKFTEDFIFRDENPSKLKKLFASENAEWKTTSYVENRGYQSYKCMRITNIWGYKKNNYLDCQSFPFFKHGLITKEFQFLNLTYGFIKS